MPDINIYDGDCYKELLLLLLRLLLEDAITTGAVVDHLKLVRSTLWRSKRAGAVQAVVVVHLRSEKALVGIPN